MPDYRRTWHPGGTYFFTVNTLRRHGCTLLTQHIDSLRTAVRAVRRTHPFRIHGWGVLPDHLHCVIEPPPGDADFATRWRLIKAGFSRRLPATERRSAVRVARGERGIWQRFPRIAAKAAPNKSIACGGGFSRAWINQRCLDPVKHGHAGRVTDWPYSTFHTRVADGTYPADWAGSVSADAVVCPD